MTFSALTDLTDTHAYTESLTNFVQASPSSFHAAQETANRLEKLGFTRVREDVAWGSEVPRKGYVIRDGAIAAWIIPQGNAAPEHFSFRIMGAHTDSPALKLKPGATTISHGWSTLGAEVYGGPLLNSFLDRDLGLAGRLTAIDGTEYLVATGPIARVAQLAPHLDRSVNDDLKLKRQQHLAPLVSLETSMNGSVEDYLCSLAGVNPEDLAFHDVVTFPTEAPRVIGINKEFFASSRLDNLSSVHAGLAALEAMEAEGGLDADYAVVFIANDHEEVGSSTRSGASGPMLEDILKRLAAVHGLDTDSYAAAISRSSCISADAGHSVHPNYSEKHDPVVQPLINNGPLLKINASQRYATDAVGAAIWKRACRRADVPSQNFVSNNDVPCGSTIGPLTATRLGMTTVDVGIPLLSMHSLREMCGVEDGPYLARAIKAYWMGA
ncbi:M18 family aminopeptidase [Actinomyces vulturis]|uniref:M18 family aminopeptidase n=1 Tax=Actinomyces vulturis TaxID=1857645 RepID=UPI0008334895|nr:M18 family aminopeptidase [Actinomyces vulturis]